ncbi:MAG: hypothetical protein ACK4F7_05055, partial [Inhella sp.]
MLPESEALNLSGELPVLTALGLPPLPVATTGDRISKMHFDHGLTRAELKALPKMLAAPVAAFASDTQPSSMVLVLPLVKGGRPVVAAVRPNAKLNRVEVNLLASAYPKDKPDQIGAWIRKGLLRYADKDKARELATIGGVQFPWMVQLARGPGGSVLRPVDVAQGAAALSRTGETSNRVTVAQLETLRDQVAKRMPNAPPIVVMQSPGEAPLDLRLHILAAGAFNDVEGALHKGRIFMFARNLTSLQRAEHVMAEHEVAHAGLRAVLGSRRQQAMQMLVNLNPKLQQQAAQKAKALGLSLPAAVEELLVDMPTAELPRLKGWRRFLEMLADGLERMGLTRAADTLRSAAAAGAEVGEQALALAGDLIRAARQHAAGSADAAARGQRAAKRLRALGLASAGRSPSELPEGAAALSTPNPDLSEEQKAAILQGPPVADLQTDAVPQTGLAAVREWAAALFEQQGGKAVSPALGEVLLDKRAVRDSMGHGKPSVFKYAAFAAVKDVLERGAVVHQAVKGPEDSFYVSAPVKINGVEDVVTVLVHRDAKTQRMYLHSVTTKEGLLNRRGSGADAEASERSGSSSSEGVASVLRRLLTLKVPGEPMLSRQAHTSVDERAAAIIATKVGKAKPFDAIAKALTKVSGVEFVAGKVYATGEFLLRRFTPEFIKAGLVDSYGLADAVKERRAQMGSRANKQLRDMGKLVHALGNLTRDESQVAYRWLNGDDSSTTAEMQQKLPAESLRVLDEVRDLIDELSQEAVRLGQLSQDAFDRNRYAYLHRSYAKHDLAQSPDEQKQRSAGVKVIGDQYKGRGIFKDAKADQVLEGKPVQGARFRRLERRLAAKPGEARPRVAEVAYVPAGAKAPPGKEKWIDAGVFEVRSADGDKLTMWRDYTLEERQAMGELDEVRYAITKTLHGMVRDVEVGRYLEWLGQNYAVKAADDVPGEIVPDNEAVFAGRAKPLLPGQWTKVPETKIPGTQVLKYGLLAGRYVEGPVWNEVRQTVEGNYRLGGPLWNKLLGWWKLSKTALSPGVHMNNVMANLVM